SARAAGEDSADADSGHDGPLAGSSAGVHGPFRHGTGGRAAPSVHDRLAGAPACRCGSGGHCGRARGRSARLQGAGLRVAARRGRSAVDDRTGPRVDRAARLARAEAMSVSRPALRVALLKREAGPVLVVLVALAVAGAFIAAREMTRADAIPLPMPVLRIRYDHLVLLVACVLL